VSGFSRDLKTRPGIRIVATSSSNNEVKLKICFMPYSSEWIPNELFLEHNGVQIFRTYKYDEGEARRFSFGTASDTTDEYDDTNFSVLDLPTFTVNQKDADETVIKNAIRSAIDGGHLLTYIEAAKQRPKFTPDDDGVRNNEQVDLESLSADGVRGLLLKIEEILLSRIGLSYRQVGGEMNKQVDFGENTIVYADTAEYTITGIILRKDADGEALMIVQDEDGGPKNDEQYVEFMETTVLIEILAALEQIINH
jgi:hypothetical protein